MATLLDLQDAWQRHPRFKNRALGGRRALDGFHYQMAVSLDHFFEAVLLGHEENIEVAFEGLSDLSENRADLTYLTQIKTTLTRESLLNALREALAVDEFLEECFPRLRDRFRFKITTRRERSSPALKKALETFVSAAALTPYRFGRPGRPGTPPE